MIYVCGKQVGEQELQFTIAAVVIMIMNFNMTAIYKCWIGFSNVKTLDFMQTAMDNTTV